MTRRCGNCGAPAPDTSSRFCDLCGAPLVDEPVAPKGLPVCPSCGVTVSDKHAQFCDVCGAPLAKPVCPSCGTPAPSSRSKFCTRCGATFGPPVPGKNRAHPAAEPEPVVVRKKKGRLPEPDPEPADEWDPWTDGDPLYDISAPLPLQPQQRPLSDLERIAAGVPRPKPEKEREPGPAGSQKKYAHLPLVADELRQDTERRAAAGAPGKDTSAGRRTKPGKKGSMFGFLK
ncbi:zinc ribbon domain-containing protein [Methanoregula sp.]|uniref:zinc ribbon domain-containing protein n=1 Tax=Methanoregula sp. TaxID=2052170 RepID=UPI002B767081|nr:zinc ribbon domain-containing protein [Methanoregula sp.]HVP96830.1 zinc ribbon domain-containing protein [Methanoregula sp.]